MLPTKRLNILGCQEFWRFSTGAPYVQEERERQDCADADEGQGASSEHFETP